MSSAHLLPASAAAPATFRLAPVVEDEPVVERVRPPPKPANPFLQLALVMSLAPFLVFFAGKVFFVLLRDVDASALDLVLPGALLTVATAFSGVVWRAR